MRRCHKTPEIARRQVALGAVGICCQKTSEAAVFVEAGIEDVLVTNQVMGEAKLPHLAALARRARIGVLVDHPLQVQALAAAAQAHAVTLDVYVEVNVGANRCGVAPGDEAVRLARQIAASTPLRFMGLHCYHGPAQHMRTPQERAAAIAGAVEAARTTRAAIEACGIAVERVTGAGTGSFLHERDSGVFNEIQAGSYVFMDRDYGDNQRGERRRRLRACAVRAHHGHEPRHARARRGRRRPEGLQRGLGPAHRVAAPRPALRESLRRAWRARPPPTPPHCRWATR